MFASPSQIFRAAALALLLAMTGFARANETPLTATSIQSRYDKEIRPLLVQYCGDCHFDGVKKGDIDLERFTTLASVQKDRRTWQQVADNLITRVMPPAKKKAQPSEAQRKLVQAWVGDALEFCDCSGPRDPGRVVIRRLNRNEYDNTIRDLLGLKDFSPSDDFPDDDTGYGFDNIGDVLTMSPLLVEKYLAAADAALNRVILTESPTTPVLVSFPGNRLQGAGAGFPRMFATQGEAYRAEKFTAAGSYEIRIEACADQGGADPARMSVRVDGREVAIIDVNAPRRMPSIYKVQVEIPNAGGHRIAVAFVNDFWDPSLSAGQRDRNLIVHRISIAGPIASAPPLSELQQRILFAQPGKKGPGEDQAAAKVLERFAARAYRRPVSEDEVSRLVGLFKKSRAAGDTYPRAMKLALSGVLVSANFLFRIEQEQSSDPEKPYFITDYELATRLSYFFWKSMPDDALTAVAASGKLREPQTLRAEVARMLADPRSQRFVKSFVGQWLVIRNLEHHSVGRERYPMFNEALRADMRREVELFFANLIKEDRSVLDVLGSDYSFMNERLAKHYEIKGVTGEEFRRVSLKGTPRAGVLTMGGVLTVTSMPSRTSPVKRGKFVLEQLLASPIPPPPPTTPPLSERRDDILRGSVRNRFEAHRSDASCIACHARMDPIGFALENFDGIGRWREKDHNFPIDASGKFPEGETFSGPIELRRVLLARKEQFVRGMVEKMMTYALGRGIENFDRCTVREIAADVVKHDYRFSALVNGIVMSDAFQKRRAKRADEFVKAE